ncbi:MAG: hypothetical protein IKJ00_04720 [Clostridia bacterium]|nr:hypothetical protein [Clostridia bacterium]
MKKIIALLLCLLLLSISLVACGGDETVETEGTDAQTTDAPETTAETTEAVTMDPADPYINDALFPALD